jgi:hypothetical protein
MDEDLGLVDGDEEGSASILDILRLSDTPQIGAACPLSNHTLMAAFGTIHLTRKMVETNQSFADQIGRGEAIYIIVYEHNSPSEIFFMGYSID